MRTFKFVFQMLVTAGLVAAFYLAVVGDAVVSEPVHFFVCVELSFWITLLWRLFRLLAGKVVTELGGNTDDMLFM